jgi:hypothetical protein
MKRIANVVFALAVLGAVSCRNPHEGGASTPPASSEQKKSELRAYVYSRARGRIDRHQVDPQSGGT